MERLFDISHMSEKYFFGASKNFFFSRFAIVEMLTFALFCYQIQLEKDVLIN